MAMEDRIRGRLAELSPQVLNVTDDSSRHAGHAGAKAGGETHFTLEITSSAFAGLSRVQRHRLVHQLLEAELNDGVHALSLVLCAPEEP